MYRDRDRHATPPTSPRKVFWCFDASGCKWPRAAFTLADTSPAKIFGCDGGPGELVRLAHDMLGRGAHVLLLTAHTREILLTTQPLPGTLGRRPGVGQQMLREAARLLRQGRPTVLVSLAWGEKTHTLLPAPGPAPRAKCEPPVPGHEALVK